MIRRPPRSTPLYSSAASDVYKRQCRVFCRSLHTRPLTVFARLLDCLSGARTGGTVDKTTRALSLARSPLIQECVLTNADLVPQTDQRRAPVSPHEEDTRG